MKPIAWVAEYQGHTSFTLDEQMGEVGWPRLGACVTALYSESNVLIAQKIAKEQTDYCIALQRAIEAHCRGELVPSDVYDDCPHHAEKLNSTTKSVLTPRQPNTL